MKKHFRVLFSVVMALIFVLPFAAFGCDANQAQNTEPQLATYTITATSNNTNYGTVYGSGVFTEGERITLAAVPKEGYEFQRWSDYDTNAVRNVTVSQDKTYTATFVAKTKYYALDKVEVYVKKVGTTTAKCVRLEGLEIDIQNHDICKLGIGGNTMHPDDGLLLLSYEPISGYYSDKADESAPVYLYSMQNQYNRFEEGATPTLSVNMSIVCSMYYYDSENDTMVVESGSHMGGLVHNRAITVSPIGKNSNSTHCVHSDTHGYEIWMRLNFVEL